MVQVFRLGDSSVSVSGRPVQLKLLLVSWAKSFQTCRAPIPLHLTTNARHVSLASLPSGSLVLRESDGFEGVQTGGRLHPGQAVNALFHSGLRDRIELRQDFEREESDRQLRVTSRHLGRTETSFLCKFSISLGQHNCLVSSSRDLY